MKETAMGGALSGGGWGYFATDTSDYDDSYSTIAMLQALFAERFQLATHRDTRELPVYALVKARADGQLGSRLVPNGCVWDFTKPPVPPKPGEPVCGNISEGFGRMTLNAIPIPVFLQYLAPKMNRVILDRTGLTGNFFTALQEQLGLKLEGARAPVDVLVIDRVERPSPD